MMSRKNKIRFFSLFIAFFFSHAVLAADAAAVRAAVPGVITKSYLQPTEQVTPAAAAAPVVTPQEQASGLTSKEAQQIHFQLNQIILEGNTVYTEAQLLPLYKDKLHQNISVADLQNIVQSITNHYRNNGYILTRAILPPQHVANGVVHVQIIEGYIDHVRVVGNPGRSAAILERYGMKIAASRPLKISVMEYYLRLANELPGVQVKAVLEPSKDKVGASDLNLATDFHVINGYVSEDNYGTRYIGPIQFTGSASVNSSVRSGDTGRVYYVTTSRPLNLRFYDLSYQTPFGSEGKQWTFGGNQSLTRPGLDLRSLGVNGTTNTVYTTFYFPTMRSRTQDLTFDAGFDYIDARVTTNVVQVEPLYTDHVRQIRGGGVYNFSDKYAGVNSLDIHLYQGLKILGATTSTTSTETSRFGGHGYFTKLNAQYTRDQDLFSRLSAHFMALGQFTFVPLLSESQFTYGGSVMGRGYDPAEIIGDRGMGGTIELRWTTSPGILALTFAQPYIFYDAGVIWNIKNVTGVKKKSSITSTGFGIRFAFTKYVSGNLMIGIPLTKIVAADAVFGGNGRASRGFFSVVASI
jgi:hemolysin activation/secretion protein